MSSENSDDPVNLFFTMNEPDGGSDSMICPIIFIHGFFATHRSWNFVKYTIANKTKRKVYCLDLRNHGQSGYSEFITLRCLMVDIENFMKCQSIPKAIFVTHSAASKPLMSLALEKPELVEKLILEDMPLANIADHENVSKKICLFAKTCDRYVRNAPAGMSDNDFRKIALTMTKQIFPEMGTSVDNIVTLPLKRNHSGKIVWDLNIDPVLHSLENNHVFQVNLSKDRQYFGKSLFLFGEKSPIKLEENKDITLKYFPNAQFYVFKGGFHIFHLEFPELFIEVVSNFIEE